MIPATAAVAKNTKNAMAAEPKSHFFIALN